MGPEPVARLAELIRLKNVADGEIAALIGRPCQIGHAGEWIASRVFDIDLHASAVTAASDGAFRSGPLTGRSVNVKWYGLRAVARIETARVACTLEDALLLAKVLQIGLPELLHAGDSDVVLINELRVPAASLSRLVTGGQFVMPAAPDPVPIEPAALMRARAVVAPLGAAGAQSREPAAPDETDRRAAGKLGVAPEDVARAAWKLWGMSLAQRRDMLLGPESRELWKEQGGAQRLRARRGHITRQLVRELQAGFSGKEKH